MMNLTRLFNKNLIVNCCLVLFVATTVSAETWPQYRGIDGDGKSPETIGNSRWTSSAPKVLWKSPTPLGFSSFTIFDGRAFTVIAKDGREQCLAMDAATGKEIWLAPLGSSEYKQGGGNAGAKDNKGGDGPRSTPTTDGKHVYVYDSYMKLTCLDAKTGQQVWQRDIEAEHSGRNIKWLNATSPVIDGDALYLAGGGAGESFLAINKNSGDVIWKSGDETMTHATPTLATIDGQKQLIYFMQSGLVSIDPANGKQLWKAVFKFSVSTAASPVVEGNLVYCSAGYGVGAAVFRVNGSSEPDEVWFKPNELMNHWSTPVVHDGHLYGLFEFKKYGTAPLQCVELATGEIKWSQRGFGPGNCIKVGDKLVVLSDAGDVVLADAKPDGYNETGRIKAISGKCWSTPAYSDGRIFVRSTQEAACLDVR
ncbi:PQQ-binding-like beta-propeller repeat protein [Stieleria marina]|uniref:Outer membrane biogenesis protein BamB n=1 Tax=Stieleria marina TaxID=1930275 RepID=A0A517NRT4_9BACT|nr:outer membrane biogenesis protein BamB [Planctomycetes bacterium K23_9]